MIEIQQLKHFLAVVRYRNFGKAAEKLHITQSGLSRSIRNLEDRVGVPLLVRSARSVTLTDYGAALVGRAHIILNEEARARQELLGIRSSESGTVRVGITLNFTQYVAPEALAEFGRRLPGIDVTVLTGSFAELVEQLRQAEIDVVFGLLVALPARELTVETLFESRSSIYATPKHPLARRRTIALADLSAATWAMLNSPGLQQAFQQHFLQAGAAPPRQQVATNSLQFLRHLVSELGHLTILPDDLVADDVRAGRLARVDAPCPGALAQAGLIYRTDSVPTMTPALKQLLATLREAAAAHAARTPRLATG